MKKTNTWWLLIMAGLILMVIGVYAFLAPLHAYMKLVKFAGLGLLFNGLFLMLVCSTNKSCVVKERNWILAESALDFAFGIVLIFNPLFSFIVFPFLIGPWILCIGVLKIIASLSLRKIVRGWIFILMVGILSAVFGLLIINNPFATSEGITILIGTFGLLLGGLNIFDSFRFRKKDDTLSMMF
ncbi:MAG TPA: DUF308 domain-containing protein [Puia sp.]|nr:DUF308 domain-containing protein [Puia sp.]